MIKEYRILLGGFGGQGVLLAGKLLADAFIEQGYMVSWMPSYGPEMRGGTCNCRVVVSEEEIINPIFSKSDVAFVLNDTSAKKFVPYLKEGGLAVSNASLVSKETLDETQKEYVEIEATKIAKEIGNEAAANVVLLGKLASQIPFLEVKSLENSLAHKFKGSVLELNMNALRVGYEN